LNQRRPGGLALELALLAGGFEFAVPRGEDFRLAPGHFVGRGDIADGAVQAPGVVVFDISGHDLAGVFQRERAAGPDALALEAFVPAFNLAVALRIKRAGPHMVFRFTIIWEKMIVIIREKRSVGIVINRERVEPRLA